MGASYVVLGAAVIGLTTALQLKEQDSSCRVTVVAKHFPGDQSIEYTSPWAGAHWNSWARDGGQHQRWDTLAYRKLGSLADDYPESGVQRGELRNLFDQPIEQAGVYSEGTGKIWYGELVGGLRPVPAEELLKGNRFGYDYDTYIIDVVRYLPWLLAQLEKRSVRFHKAFLEDIRDLFREFPDNDAYFNCTGLGSLRLKGIEDSLLYPTRGQTMLVEQPDPPLRKQYKHSSAPDEELMTYVFPRGSHGGVLLGGSHTADDWNGAIDMDLAAEIKRRCCALCPELGHPEDLKVIRHQVGLRPSRRGGAQLERTLTDGKVLIHSYGLGGTGYQASWGMAKDAVDLLIKPMNEKSSGQSV